MCTRHGRPTSTCARQGFASLRARENAKPPQRLRHKTLTPASGVSFTCVGCRTCGVSGACCAATRSAAKLSQQVIWRRRAKPSALRAARPQMLLPSSTRSSAAAHALRRASATTFRLGRKRRASDRRASLVRRRTAGTQDGLRFRLFLKGKQTSLL